MGVHASFLSSIDVNLITTDNVNALYMGTWWWGVVTCGIAGRRAGAVMISIDLSSPRNEEKI